MKSLLFISLLFPCFCFGQLTVIMTQTNVLCNGDCNGTATATPIGPPPISYTWSNNATTSTIVNLCPGTYIVTVVDAVPDTVIDSVTVTEPLPLIVDSFLMTPVLCNGDCDGAVTVWLSGGTVSYSYNWIPSGQTSETATALCAGTHCLEITDANFCTLDTCITVTQPTPLTSSTSIVNDPPAACDVTVDVTVSGGNPGYTFIWDDPSSQTTQTATGLCADTFHVTITDSLGCVIIDSIITTDIIGAINDISLKNDLYIYPNPTTGKFRVESLEFGVEKIEVYDLFGRLVLCSNKPQIDMSSYPAGVYFVKAGQAVRKLIKQ